LVEWADADVDSVMDTASASVAAAPLAQHDRASKTVSGYLGEKGEEWKALYEKKRPLTLLELPVDILRLIVKEACYWSPRRIHGHSLLTV
jgi:hypothetical protein